MYVEVRLSGMNIRKLVLSKYVHNIDNIIVHITNNGSSNNMQ